MAKESANEKAKAEKAAPDPVSTSVDPGTIETMDDLGIGPRDPYPTGNPPEPPEAPPSDRAKVTSEPPRVTKEQADRERVEREKAQTAPPVRSSRT